MTFRSDVGSFYYGMLVLVFAVTALAFNQAFQLEGPGPGTDAILSLMVTLVFGCGLPVWLLFSTDYTVTPSELNIRCGPFKWRVNRSDIHGITPSRNLISSPALSLHRLDISYGNNRHILVSPKDRSGFYRALGFTPPSDL